MQSRSRSRVRLGILAVATSPVLALIHTTVAQAITSVGNFTYYVNSATDTSATDCTSPGNSDCGIDDAVTAFNADTITNDADTIVFNSSIPTFTSIGTSIDNATSGVTLAINGNGQGVTAVTGGNTDRVFTVDGGAVTITGLTIEAGNATLGGGVFISDGTTHLTRSTITNNNAVSGAGVVNFGTAYLTNDTFAGNKADDNGGGVLNSGTAYLTNDTLTENSAVNGGAVYNDNTVSLTYDTLAGNGGGAINTDGPATIANSILDDGPGECAGAVIDGGYNVEADQSCFGSASDDVENSSTINLAPLAANGSSGPETLAIGTDSSAFEEVPAASCAPVVDGTPITTDERDDSRPGVAGADCDAGAYELQASVSSFHDSACGTWNVPSGVSSIDIAAFGAAGADTTSADGGPGDEVAGTLSVVPAQTLDICVDRGGARGGDGVSGASEPGGSGGGASGVALGFNFSTPVLVAGGGGGAGGIGSNGAQGGSGGGAGHAGDDGNGDGAGTGGTTGTGGSSGVAGPGAGGAGSAGGGVESSDIDGGGGGGGGGGGYVGGGGGHGGQSLDGVGQGGGGGGGGAGGSDYCDASLTGCHTVAGAGTGTVAGTGAGDPRVVFTYVRVPTVAVSYPVDASTYGTNWGGSVTGSATVNAGGAALHAVAVSIQKQGGNCWSGSGSDFTASCPNFVPATTATSWSRSLPAPDLTSGDSYEVTAEATDSYGDSGTSPTRTFTYDTTAPSVSVSYPAATGSYDSSTWTGTITGTAIANATAATISTAAVQIEDTTATTYWDGSSWQASPTLNSAALSSPNWSYGFSAANLTPGHGYTVTGQATDSAGNVGTSTPVSFTFVSANPRPSVSSVSPTAGPMSGGTPITIMGSGFVTGAKVEIGQGQGAGPSAIMATNVHVVSPTKITATTGGHAKAGNWNVFVVTGGGTSTANSGSAFTYAAVPDVYSVTPSSGPRTGGTHITITGSGFIPGAKVEIGQSKGAGPTAIMATNVVVVSAGKITAVTGGNAKPGVWNVFIVTAGGTSAAKPHNDSFSYT